MRYLVAVSGGIDSVVLLDQLVKQDKHELIVAHFDHGIRSDSADDARFVEGLAWRYSLSFVTARKELGPKASEEQARHARYDFLQSTAEEYQATIATAHHADDVIETIAINLRRGTGWRGIGVMRTRDIIRPLLEMSKEQIRAYAVENRLEWVEDSTNSSGIYLRNRLRQKIALGMSKEMKGSLLTIWCQQLDLRLSIERELREYANQDEYSRYFINQVDERVARELVRAAIIMKSGRGPTRPQLERAVLAIKTARAGATYEIGDGVKLLFSVRSFVVETP